MCKDGESIRVLPGLASGNRIPNSHTQFLSGNCRNKVSSFHSTISGITPDIFVCLLFCYNLCKVTRNSRM